MAWSRLRMTMTSEKQIGGFSDFPLQYNFRECKAYQTPVGLRFVNHPYHFFSQSHLCSLEAVSLILACSQTPCFCTSKRLLLPHLYQQLQRQGPQMMTRTCLGIQKETATDLVTKGSQDILGARSAKDSSGFAWLLHGFIHVDSILEKRIQRSH